MAKITITVTDINLADNTYKVDFDAEGSEIDQGQATAAYFTGYYLHTLADENDFANAVATFGRTLVQNMTNDDAESFPAPDKLASVSLILEDADLSTGRYKPSLEFHGGNPAGENLPSAAQVVAVYMRNLLNSMDFQKSCWAFAETMIRDNDMAHIANSEYGPAENDDTATTFVA